MNDKMQPPNAGQGLFVRSSDVDTMRQAPIRIVRGRPGEAPGAGGATADLTQPIDFSLLDDIFENFLEVTGLPIAVIDLNGQVLASSRWQRLCMDFFRANPQTLAGCLTSDNVLSRQLAAGGESAIHRCANGLTDCATPIRIEGVHVANLFTGQFLLAAPDLDDFKRHQQTCGFDEEAFFKALSEIPIVSEKKIPAILKLLRGLAQQIARQSLAEKRARSAMAEIERQVAERTRKLKKAEAEQKRLNRTLKLLGDSNAVLLHADHEEKLLPDVCRLIVKLGGYLMAWVGMAETDAEKSVRPVGQSGYEAGYLDSVRIFWGDGEFGRGPTGTAIRTGKTQVNRDVLSNPRMKPWRAAAIERGYRSSIALPLRIDGKVAGALTIYAQEAEAFAREEVRLLEKMANNLAYGISVLRDRKQLAIANRELQGFTYAASHDMKAPLGRILSFSALLEKHYRDRLEGDGLLFLDFIRQNAVRIMALIEDLLEHAQVEQRNHYLQTVDLPAAVQLLLQEKADDIREAGARVDVDVPAVAVHANPLGLAQVLRNLLENALKYAAGAKPPVIEIAGRVEGRNCRLWVRDNGIGFDMAYHGQIFEIFRRLHSYAEYPGNGVGLALVKKAMEHMGGRVWAESSPGQGACFFLEMPLQQGGR